MPPPIDPTLAAALPRDALSKRGRVSQHPAALDTRACKERRHDSQASPHDPLRPVSDYILCHLHTQLAQWDQAIPSCLQSMAANPQLPYPYIDLTAAYGWLGRTSYAKAALADLLKQTPGFTAGHRGAVGLTVSGITARFRLGWVSGKGGVGDFASLANGGTTYGDRTSVTSGCRRGLLRPRARRHLQGHRSFGRLHERSLLAATSRARPLSATPQAGGLW